MSWEYDLANKLKEKNDDMKSKSINQSTPFIGTVESVNPLIISIENGDLMYDETENEIIKTKLFTSRIVQKDDSVICLPCEGLTEIIIIDLEG